VVGFTVATAAIGCRVALGDDKLYSCATTADCGGDGFVCAAPAGGAGRCCKSTGSEKCNGLDDDCNGLIDDGFPAELCNGLDDNCDGKIDEAFNLVSDALHCGQCGAACAADSICVASVCKIANEAICTDGLDNDADAKTDCADPDCNLKSCGTGCACRAGRKAEGNCTNAADDDGDAKVDCADEDCAGAGCAADGGTGCTCGGLAKKETDCRDTFDNDLDTAVDCADPDCLAQLCQPAPSTFRCGAGNACACNDGGTTAETGALLCRDRVDNDCDGLLDCAEADCNFLSCSPDGGFGCRCLFGGRSEVDCADRKDNDEDGVSDCGDAQPDGGGDCPISTACTYLNSGGVVKAGSCAADRTCK